MRIKMWTVYIKTIVHVTPIITAKCISYLKFRMTFTSV